MFKIPAKETAIACKLFAYSLIIATSYIAARTVGDSLFLSQIGNEQLALVYVMAGLGTAVIAGLWYLATRKLSVTLAIQLSSAGFAALTLLAWCLLPTFGTSFWLLACIYLLAEVKGCINAINIVSALNTKLGRNSSRMSWAFVGLAAPIAAAVIGGVLAAESQVLALRDWLVLIVCLDLLGCFIGIALSREANVNQSQFRIGKFTIRQRPHRRAGKTYVSAIQFQKWIGILISAKVIVLTIVSFEWKSSANSYFDGQSAQLVRFFGIYYGAVGIATVAFQLFVTSRILRNRNFHTPLMFMPIGVSLFATVFFFGAAPLVLLIATTGAKAMDSWRRSIHDTSINLLYTRIMRGNRRRAISINNGLIKPISEVAAAIVIYVGALQIHRPLLVIVTIVWLFSAIKLCRLIRANKKQMKPVNRSWNNQKLARLEPKV